MKEEQSKNIIEKIKENPAIDFAQIKVLQAELESVKNNLDNTNEIDALTKTIDVYKKIIKVAPMLESTLKSNLELMNKTLQNLKNK
jgi:ribosome maturation protein Sdo1